MGVNLTNDQHQPLDISDLEGEVTHVHDHIHNRERWLGDTAVEASLTPYQAISGNGDYGADANDEADLLTAGDTPVIAGMTLFDFRELMVEDVSADTPYVLRIVYGTGTMGDAITAGQYTMTMVQFDSTNPQLSAGVPVEVRIPQLAATTKVWVQAKNVTNNATIDFFVGIHEYVI